MTEGICSVEGCGRPVRSLGLCGKHYLRQRRHRSSPPPPRQHHARHKRGQRCSECDSPAVCRGLCMTHYGQWRAQTAPSCVVDGCDTAATVKGLCPRHYQRLMKYGDPLAGPAFRRKRGTGLPAWAYWQRRDEQRYAAEPDLLAYVEILRRDPCSYCGAPCEHIDHLVPVDSGGALVVENVTAACASCNHRKAHTPLLLFLHARL